VVGGHADDYGARAQGNFGRPVRRQNAFVDATATDTYADDRRSTRPPDSLRAPSDAPDVLSVLLCPPADGVDLRPPGPRGNASAGRNERPRAVPRTCSGALGASSPPHGGA
jgi:hypothetical protein